MNARRSLLAAATAAALAAVAASAWAYGPGMRNQGANCPAQADCPMAAPGPMAGAGPVMGPGPMGAGPRGGMRGDPAAVGARLEQLKAALKLQPNQMAAWDAYEARVKAQAAERAKLRESMANFQGDPQARADQRVALMKQRAAAAEEINGLRKALYGTLSAEQKATFDQHYPAAGPMAGPHGRGGARS